MTHESDGQGISRRRFIHGGAAGGLALSAGALLAACGSSNSSSSASSSSGATSSGSASSSSSAPTAGTSTGPAGGTPVKGGTLRIGLVSAGSAETIDVRKALNFPDYVRLFNLLDPLFFAAAGGLVKPGLVEEATSNKDATVWTLRLRDGVTWHDGKPLTADDVLYTIRASWGSKMSNIYSFAVTVIDFKKLRKIDNLTVEVPLLLGIAQFPSVTFTQNTFVIQNGTTDFSKVVGTGPFKLESFTPGTQSVFTANRNYWQSPEPYVDTLIINSSYPNDNARLNALLAGDVDIVPTVPQALAKANAASGRIVLGNAPGPAFVAPTMIIDRPPFTDVRVRQAMRFLADRQAMALEGFDGYATPGNDCPGNTLQFWASSLHREADPERAKSLLKAAGQEKLALTLYTADIIPGMNETATLYAQQAAAGGVDISIKVVDPAIYYSAASPGGNYLLKTFSINNWTTETSSMALFYLSALYKSAPYNETHWSSTSADNLLFDALAETNDAAAEQKWFAVQELQYNEGGYIVTNNFNWLDAYSTKVRGIQTTALGPCNYYDFKTAWLAA
jgi:peptide/nickel transport system substrate-binding protein